MARFDGKAVLVTGANSGIGAATAQAFGAEGARLMMTGVDAEAGAEVMAEINGAGGDARFIQGDLTDCLSPTVRVILPQSKKLKVPYSVFPR